MGTVAFNIASR